MVLTCFFPFFTYLSLLLPSTPLQLLKIRNNFFLFCLLSLPPFHFGGISESRAALSSLALWRHMLCPAPHLAPLPGSLLTLGLWEIAKSGTGSQCGAVNNSLISVHGG